MTIIAWVANNGRDAMLTSLPTTIVLCPFARSLLCVQERAKQEKELPEELQSDDLPKYQGGSLGSFREGLQMLPKAAERALGKEKARGFGSRCFSFSTMSFEGKYGLVARLFLNQKYHPTIWCASA